LLCDIQTNKDDDDDDDDDELASEWLHLPYFTAVVSFFLKA